MNFEKLLETSLQAAVEKLGGTLERGDSETDTVEIKLAVSSLPDNETP